MVANSATLPVAPFAAARACILVVEDEPLIRMLLSDELRDEGYQVIEACDGDEAAAFLETNAPDRIISDVRMPGSLDGLGLLALVKQTRPALPVIIASAHLRLEVALDEGAANFIAKPYTMRLVVEAVQNELAKAQ